MFTVEMGSSGASATLNHGPPPRQQTRIIILDLFVDGELRQTSEREAFNPLAIA